jgi:hypothetical protein
MIIRARVPELTLGRRGARSGRGRRGSLMPYQGGDRQRLLRREACADMDRMAGLDAKVARAREVIPVLQGEIDDYYASNPIVLRLEHREEPKRMEAVVESVRQPPPRLGVLMGEFAHNLRSTFDHLVWQLALTQTSTPHDRLQFPILDNRPSEADWRSMAGDRLQQVPPEAVQRIGDLQPFHSVHPEINALAIVRELSNEDKHRVILQPVSVSKQPDESNVVLDAHDVEVITVEVMVGAPPEPGATLVRVPYTIVGDAPRLNLHVAFPAEVHFGRIGFRALAMHSVTAQIAGLVRGFEPMLA